MRIYDVLWRLGDFPEEIFGTHHRYFSLGIIRLSRGIEQADFMRLFSEKFHRNMPMRLEVVPEKIFLRLVAFIFSG